MIRRVVVAIALVAVGLFMSLGYSAVAQMNRPASTPNSSQVSAADRQFIMDAGHAGMAGIMLGQLALQRGTSTQVKQFAQAEIDEQTQVKNDLMRIAPRLGVNVPTDPAPRHQAAMAQLQQLQGERFDAAYMSEGGINAHLENASIFQREAAFGQNPDLVGVASKGLPMIGRHFQTASSLTNYRFASVPQRFNNTSSVPGRSTPQSNNKPAMSTPQ